MSRGNQNLQINNQDICSKQLESRVLMGVGDNVRICGSSKENDGWHHKVHNYTVMWTPETFAKQYLGCYKDTKRFSNLFASRLMKGYQQNFPDSLTPKKCISVCKSKGFAYAGVQHSEECFCDIQQPPESESAPDHECSKECSGDKSIKCGGSWRLNVYNTGLTSSNEALRYVGCFVDTIPVLGPRLLKGLQTDFPESLTIQKCISVCSSKRFHFAGMQYRFECFCGDERPSLRRSADEGDCNAKCSGDASQICGGDWRISVYETGIEGTDEPAPPSPSVPPEPSVIAPTEIKQPDEEKSTTTFNGKTATRGTVMFYDSFDGTSISQSNWQHTIKIADEPDFEFCVFTADPTNSYVNNGQLVIKPSVMPDNFVQTGNLQLQDCTGKPGTKECGYKAKTYLILPPVQSARINTLKSFSFRYGIVEIIARMPVGDWLLPGPMDNDQELWLEPKSKVYGSDYNSGRIRIAMSRGNQNLQMNNLDISCKQLESGVLMGVGDNVKSRASSKENNGWHQKMHNFTAVWTSDNLAFFIDGEQQYSLLPSQGIQLSDILGFTFQESKTWKSGTNLAPFDTEFYISLGLSAGGVRDFPDKCINNGRLKPWRNFEVKATLKFWQDHDNWLATWNGEDAALHVDSVKVTAV